MNSIFNDEVKYKAFFISAVILAIIGLYSYESYQIEQFGIENNIPRSHWQSEYFTHRRGY